LRQRGGERAHVLNDIANQAIDQRSAVLGKSLGELRETKVRVVKSVDETTNDIDTFP
jgi:hypothetical protein